MFGLKVVSLALAAAVLVLGAAPGVAKQHPAADGYTFAKKEWVVSKVEVRFVEYASFRELREAMPDPGRQVGKVKAWSRVSSDGFCEVHIVDQAVAYTPAAIGHEIAHCLYGRFHD